MRSPGRRRPQPRVRLHSQNAILMGPIVQDGVSGFHMPRRFTILQRGVPVDRRYSAGSRDRPQTY